MVIVTLTVVLGVVALGTPAAGVEEEGSAEGRGDGEALFTSHRCGLCHDVARAGIRAKARSSEMKGPDLSELIPPKEIEDLAAYLRQESERQGGKHLKGFKGSDEELQAILDWLGSLEAQDSAE